MLLKIALDRAEFLLTEADVPSPRVDAELLLTHVLGISRGELQTRLVLEQSCSEGDFDTFAEFVRRRCARIPLQHLTGLAPFRDFELTVGNGVFIPRPETEGVVQLGIDFLAGISGAKKAVDLGSGSGAIAIALSREVSDCHVVAVEISEQAAVFTAKNIGRLAPVVELRIGSMVDCVNDLEGELDLVISNPPYIPIDAVPIDVEVRDHDPALALYGGIDGLDVIREISILALKLLKSGGALVLEHADGQSDLVCELLLESGWQKVSPHKDATNRLRSVSARKA